MFALMKIVQSELGFDLAENYNYNKDDAACLATPINFSRVNTKYHYQNYFRNQIPFTSDFAKVMEWIKEYKYTYNRIKIGDLLVVKLDDDKVGLEREKHPYYDRYQLTKEEICKLYKWINK